jgi:hypothetical protein
MFSPVAFSLLVLGVVLFAIFVRQTTDYVPESRFRLWTTRAAVAVIILWFMAGSTNQIAMQRGRGLGHVLLSPSFGRGIVAILLIWIVFRDEL